jgi:hypothetical protein
MVPGAAWTHPQLKALFSQEASRPSTHTSLCVSRQAGPLLQGPLLLVPAPVAAVVVVMWCLAGGRAVQGGIAEVGPMGALSQCGDGALHGAGIWGRLWARDKGWGSTWHEGA